MIMMIFKMPHFPLRRGWVGPESYRTYTDKRGKVKMDVTPNQNRFSFLTIVFLMMGENKNVQWYHSTHFFQQPYHKIKKETIDWPNLRVFLCRRNGVLKSAQQEGVKRKTII